MITRSVEAGLPARAVNGRRATGDEVYGADPDLRVFVESGDAMLTHASLAALAGATRTHQSLPADPPIGR